MCRGSRPAVCACCMWAYCSSSVLWSLLLQWLFLRAAAPVVVLFSDVVQQQQTPLLTRLPYTYLAACPIWICKAEQLHLHPQRLSLKLDDEIFKKPIPGSGKRWVSYWISIHDINASLAIDQLRAAGGTKVATSVMVDCGDEIQADGTLTRGNFTGCESLISAVQAMGIGAERLIQSAGDKIGPLRAMYAAPEPSIGALVALAKEQKLRGISWDVEPEKDAAGKRLTHADAVQYARYLSKLRAELNPLGVRLTTYNEIWYAVH